MLHDYFRSFWRGVLHNKLHTFINVFGLALGLTVFFALILYVYREFSWDAHWQDADRMYRAVGRLESPTGSTLPIISNAPYVLGEALQSRNPGAFEVFARVHQQQATLAVGDDEYPNQVLIYAEPALLDLLQLETMEGSLDEVFADPRSVAINQRVVERYFGTASPLGSTIVFSSSQAPEKDFVVKAVYRVPEPSMFALNMPFMTLLDAAVPPVPNAGFDLWRSVRPPEPSALMVMHYFKLRDGVEAALPEADLRAFLDQNRYLEGGNSKTRYIFQKLSDVHLSPGPFDTGDSVQRLWVFAAVGALVLFISGCNFIMLATLRSIDRMRELGIRKTVGGGAGQLMRQYLLDAFCHTLAAAIIAVLLLQLVLPALQSMLQFSLELNLLNWRSMGLCLGIVTAFTLITAAWPALLMSRGKPAALLRHGGATVMRSGNTLRRLLVGMQFAIVIVLLLGAAVVQQQIAYSQNRDRGFSLDNVVAMRLNSSELIDSSTALVTEFRRLPGVEHAAVGGAAPGTIMISTPPMVKWFAPDGSFREAPIEGSSVGGGYFSTLSVPLLAGREFSAVEEAAPPAEPGEQAPAVRNVLINRSAASALGFARPELAVEQLLEIDVFTAEGEARKQGLRVIGVVADTQLSSVMLPPVPQYYAFSVRNSFLAIKLQPDADVSAVTNALQVSWDGIIGGTPFALLPPEQVGGNQMYREQFEARILIGSTILAMVIALLGLYGLVAATVVRRTKEIGVRKVMGADNKSIVALLLWQFSKPIAIANLLAWPFGFWAISQWLQRFPYQIDSALILLSGVAASAVALLIAWLTVGFMAAKAARAKPVRALRYE